MGLESETGDRTTPCGPARVQFSVIRDRSARQCARTHTRPRPVGGRADRTAAWSPVPETHFSNRNKEFPITVFYFLAPRRDTRVGAEHFIIVLLSRRAARGGTARRGRGGRARPAAKSRGASESCQAESVCRADSSVGAPNAVERRASAGVGPGSARSATRETASTAESRAAFAWPVVYTPRYGTSATKRLFTITTPRKLVWLLVIMTSKGIG